MTFPDRSRPQLLAALALLALLALAPAAVAKGKKATCKSGQATVTTGKKTACVPLAKALPKPRDADIRLLYLRQAAKRAPAKTPAQKRAQRKLLSALPRALALLDRNAASGAGASGAADPVASASACSPDGPIENIGSHQGVGIAAVGNNGGQMTINSGGLTFRTRFAKCGFTGFALPECPAANGDVNASGRSSFQVTEEVLDGERVVSRRSTTVESKSRGRGKVAADAKLDYVVFSSVEETFIVASGGVVHRGTTEYEARVNMRSGSYEGAARVRAGGDAKAADGAQSFASLVEEGIKDFRIGEVGGAFLRDDGWATFNRKRGSYCAKATFSPEVNTVKLRKGKKGEVSVYAKARDGGKASEARWTLLDQDNAEFSPTSSQQAEPRISYTVTKAPVPGFVKVKVKFTSTAGVGEDTWTQPTEKGPTINRIAGTFSQRSDFFGSVIQWDGNVTFERVVPAIAEGASGIFSFKEGQMTVTASGNGAQFVSAPLCSQRGSTQLSFSALSTQMIVLGSGDEQTEPYQYSFAIDSSNAPPATLRLEIYNCAEEAKAQEGFYDIPMFFGMSSKGLLDSADGIAYEGFRNESPLMGSTAETWSFKGSE